MLNSLIGITFLGIALASTFLMFYLWKFPYDKEKNQSSAPITLTTIHRLLGYAYVILYVYMMWQMVPRLWAYQIELPARTVFHLTLGMSIGAILITKIAIVRFFKHLETKLVPFLGSGLLICTLLLTSLALPFSLREAYLKASALDSDAAVIEERISRVREQLPKAGVTDETTIDQLATLESLEDGRDVLMIKCTQCHDLRTVLARPRTPDSWKQTISRMANRSTILNHITEQDQLKVTAYLIAISPTLQKTLVERRKLAMQTVENQQASMDVTKQMVKSTEDKVAFDLEQAKDIFERRCSQCHDHTQVEQVELSNKEDTIMLVQRMVGNGLTLDEGELPQIVQYITDTYAKGEGLEPGELEETDESKQPESGVVLDGANLYMRRACVACHGAEGRAPIAPNYPYLAGQNKQYLIEQIKEIRNGDRNSGLASVMQGAVINISEEEIEAIAEYLSQQSQ